MNQQSIWNLPSLLLFIVIMMALLLSNTTCNKDKNEPPIASFIYSPSSGLAGFTEFVFDGSGSYDKEDPDAIPLKTRWDFDGDDYWDTDWLDEQKANYIYESRGSYSVTMQVKDSDGLTAYNTKLIGVGQPCPGMPTIDYAGQKYHTVMIGEQCWLQENLNVGEMLIDDQYPEDNGTVEKYCLNHNPDSCTKYGGLYRWEEMMQYVHEEGIQGICPDGWHIPSDEEWKILEGSVDSQYRVGDPEWDLYEERGHDADKNLITTSGWPEGFNGRDSYGFSGKPGGIYSHIFISDRIDAYWFTSTKVGLSSYIFRRIYNQRAGVRRGVQFFHDHVSAGVRCIKD